MSPRGLPATLALCALPACIAAPASLDAGASGGLGSCAPPCAADEACQAGDCVPLASVEDELQHCADTINGYRAQLSLAALARSGQLEAYAAEGAAYDAVRGDHAHFTATQGGGLALAENEIPGWPLGASGSVLDIIDEGTALMWGEGPGGPHYENIAGPFSEVGCGVYVTEQQYVWVVQDFR